MAGDLTSDGVVAYLAQAIARASATYTTRPATDPQHALALGEAVALFNLADEFRLIVPVRAAVDAQAGYDVYSRLSEAMKAYYLGLPGRPANLLGGDRPVAPRPTGQRPAGPRPPGPRPSSSRPPTPRPPTGGHSRPGGPPRAPRRRPLSP